MDYEIKEKTCFKAPLFLSAALSDDLAQREHVPGSELTASINP